MDFLSFGYGAVVVCALVVYDILPGRYRPMFLAALNVALLLLVAPVPALIVIGLALTVFLLSVKRPGPATVALPLIVLGYFKYSHFVVHNLNRLGTSVALPPVMQVLGLSYFTFRLVSFSLDVMRKKITAPSLTVFINYVFFFSTVVAGPIDRYHAFVEASGTREEDVLSGASRIITGLFKKIVLAGALAAPATWLTLRDLPASRYVLSMYAYTFLIYFDFSGYTDIAVGTARLFGYRIMENFASPYTKTNISAFWKSWHMSLTQWFRDYLFIPLGGSRGTLARTVLNTVIVMLVTGLWHGASWNFVFWGLYHAAGLSAYRLYSVYIRPRLPGTLLSAPGMSLFSWALTFHFVAFGWILFHTSTRQFIYIAAKLISGVIQ
ncbi:MAG: MBOAT family O-acyltransferase [Bacillota bacterium]